MSSPRLIQTYLIDGTLEGIRVINYRDRLKINCNVNAWTTWKNSAGETMDQVKRSGE